MQYFKVCSQHMLRFSRMYSRQTWLSTHACASSKLFGASLVRAKSTAVQEAVPATFSQGNKFRISVAPSGNEDLSSIADLYKDDMKNINQNVLKLLRDYNASDEMCEVATYLIKNEPFSSLSTCHVLHAKALSCHLFGNGNLTPAQKTIISLIHMEITACLISDDIGDTASIRFDLPSAHIAWNSRKAIAAVNMMFAITVSESAKLGHDVLVSMCNAHERARRGAFIETLTSDLYDGDLFWNYISSVEDKAGNANRYWAKALAQVSGASELFIDSSAQLGYNNWMFGQFIDDIKDVEFDIKDGHATATVINASKEHPELIEMIARSFNQEGDVEKAMELVNKTPNAKEEAIKLARRYLTQTLVQLELLVDSPYKAALQTLFCAQFAKINRK